MKLIVQFSQLILLVLNLFSGSIKLEGQSIATISTLPSCESHPTGTITISLNPQLFEPDYDLPVHIEWVNIDNNDAGSLTQTGYIGNISNVGPGNYIIEIELSDKCVLTTSTIVGSISILVSRIIIQPNGQYCDEGSIELLLPTVGGGGEGGGGERIYAFDWSSPTWPAFNDDDAKIDHLTAGIYCVTITNSIGCTKEKCFTLSCGVYFEGVVTNADESDNCEEGAIDITVTSGTSPFNYEWSSPTWVNSHWTTEDIARLRNGIYCVTVTDAVGSTFSTCFEVECCPDPSIQSEVSITHYCESTFGSIDFVNDWHNFDYLATWSGPNGFMTDYQDQSSYDGITDLLPGTYILSLFDQTRTCTYEYQYEVLDYSIDLVVNEIQNPGFSGPNQSAYPGFIDISIESNQPYIVSWYTSENGYIDNFVTHNEDLTNAYVDDYIVVVETEYCTYTSGVYRLSACYKDTPDGPISLAPQIIVEDHVFFTTDLDACIGAIDLNLTSGTSPYYRAYYSWSGPNGFESDDQDISGLCPGEYCVTISNGCHIFSDCYNVRNIPCDNSLTDAELADLFVQDIQIPCDGTLGSIQVSLPFSSEVTRIVYIDPRYPLPNDVTAEEFIAYIDNLQANQTIHITAEIGGCIFDFDYKIKASPIIQVFNHLDGLTCIYDQYCGDEGIGQISQHADIRFLEGETGFFGRCTAPIYCGGEYVDDIEFPRITVTVAEYVAILDALIEFLTPDYYAVLIADLANRDLDPCNRIRYCPATFEITGEDPSYEIFGDLNSPPPIQDGPCLIYDCPFPLSNITVCPDDLDVIPPLQDYVFGNFPKDCLPVQYPFIQIIAWEEGNIFPPEYYTSSLREFIQTFNHDERSGCANVRFCCNTFDFIYSDISQIVCGDQFGCIPVNNVPPAVCNAAWNQDHTLITAACSSNSNNSCAGTYIYGNPTLPYPCEFSQFNSPDPKDLVELSDTNKISANSISYYDVFKDKVNEQVTVTPTIFTNFVNANITYPEIAGINLFSSDGIIIQKFWPIKPGLSRLAIKDCPSGVYFLQFYNLAGQNIGVKAVIHE